MTVTREFFSNLTKIKRTPLLLFHLITPVVVTALFLLYYAFAGYHIIPDVRSFFILLQLAYPMFISIVVPLFIHLDRNIYGIQNALGLVESRTGVYAGKILFLLFLSAMSMIIYEGCFYAGANWILDIQMDFGSYLIIFGIFMLSSLFIYAVHVPIAFRFGSSVSVLLGISGTILAGLFENPIGDKIWFFIPWEWGIRFLKRYFGFSGEAVFPGIIAMAMMTALVLLLSILWYSRWEGKVTQE